MKYLDIINNCQFRLDNEFKEFESALKRNDLFSDLHSHLSSDSFISEFQLVDITLSFYVPELENADEDGIDISIGLFQIRKDEDGMTSYTSNIRYDSDGDLIFDKFLYVTSGINTTTGAVVLENSDYVINVSDVDFFDKELSQVIDSIFASFTSNISLMISKLLELKNCT